MILNDNSAEFLRLTAEKEIMRQRQSSDHPVRFVLPALSLMLLVAVYPLAATFWLSLRDEFPIFHISRFVGFSHYARCGVIHASGKAWRTRPTSPRYQCSPK